MFRVLLWLLCIYNAAASDICEASVSNAQELAIEIDRLHSHRGAFREDIVDNLHAIVAERSSKVLPLDRFTVLERSGGSVTTDTTLAVAEVSTLLDSFASLLTRNVAIYTSGRSLITRFTARFEDAALGIEMTAGMFSPSDTLAVGMKDGVFGVYHAYRGNVEMQQLFVFTAGNTGDQVYVKIADYEVYVTFTSPTPNFYNNIREIVDAFRAIPNFDKDFELQQGGAVLSLASKTQEDIVDTNFVVGNVIGTLFEASWIKLVDGAPPIATWYHNFNGGNLTFFDPGKLNLFQITFGFLGVASLQFQVLNPDAGNWVLIHVIHWAGKNDFSHTQNPSFQVGMKIHRYAFAGVPAPANIKMQSFFIGQVGKGITPRTQYAAYSGYKTLTTSLKPYTCITVRNVFLNLKNQGILHLKSASVATSGTGITQVFLVLNPTQLLGAEWLFVDAQTSLALSTNTATTISGGQLLKIMNQAASSSQTIVIQENIIMNGEDVLCIAAQSSDSGHIAVSINWSEFY